MFQGFTPEAIDFLWGIRMNNNREWFQQNKQVYVNSLYQPMKELGKELFVPFLDRPGNVLKVSRIYRDARMHHPDPYKESLWICIRQDVEWWAENPCLYFEITPEGISYGFFLYRARPQVMEQFRQYISAYPREFLDLIRTTEEAVGGPITAACYKRPKAADDPELDRFFAWKERIGFTVDIAPGEEMFGPELKDRVAELFQKLTPLYEYFNRFKV